MSLCCNLRTAAASASVSARSRIVGGVSAQCQSSVMPVRWVNASQLQSIRTKRTSSSGGGGGSRSTPIAGSGAARGRALRKLSKTTGRKNGGGGEEGEWVFGLRPVNYKTAPAPEICMSPPPPPPKAGLAKYTFPVSAFLTVAITAYFYVNNQNDSFAYWEAMQTGGIMPDDYDDDEDDFDDEEGEE